MSAASPISSMDELLERNRVFAATGRHVGLRPTPRKRAIIITCFDPRVDPAHILGVELGDAVVLRNMGGRVTPDICLQISILATMAEQLTTGRPPEFEIALLHHTRCGAQSLTDPLFRQAVTERSAATDASLADIGANDPVDSVATDVARVLALPHIAALASVHGYVYDVDSGVVTRH